MVNEPTSSAPCHHQRCLLQNSAGRLNLALTYLLVLEPRPGVQLSNTLFHLPGDFCILASALVTSWFDRLVLIRMKGREVGAMFTHRQCRHQLLLFGFWCPCSMSTCQVKVAFICNKTVGCSLRLSGTVGADDAEVKKLVQFHAAWPSQGRACMRVICLTRT